MQSHLYHFFKLFRRFFFFYIYVKERWNIDVLFLLLKNAIDKTLTLPGTFIFLISKRHDFNSQYAFTIEVLLYDDIHIMLKKDIMDFIIKL